MSPRYIRRQESRPHPRHCVALRGSLPEEHQLARFIAMSRDALDKAQKEMKEIEPKTSNPCEENIYNFQN